MNLEMYSLLKVLVEYNVLTVPSVIESLNWSNRQFDYALSQVNDYLEIHHVLPISRKERELIVSSEIYDFYYTYILKEEYNYFFSQKERHDLILLILLSSNDYISVNYIEHVFDVSRSTVLNDIKSIQNNIQKEIDIVYFREFGYVIQGNEYLLRNVLLEKIAFIHENHFLFNKYLDLLKFKREHFSQVEKIINELEQMIGTKIAKEHKEILILMIMISKRRDQKGHTINLDANIEETLYDTPEFIQVRTYLKENLKIKNKDELNFLTLLYLSQSLSRISYISNDMIPKLKTAIEETIIEFEKKACVSFDNKEELTKALFQHLKPSYYRHKYNIKLNSDIYGLYSTIDKNSHFLTIRSIISMCLYPIEELFESKIQDVELDLITIIILGWMRREEKDFANQIRVGLIGDSRASTYMLMHAKLKNIFPEFYFVGNFTKEEIKKIPRDQLDLIFTTDEEILKYDNAFRVEPHEIVTSPLQLRARIFQDFLGIKSSGIEIDSIMSIIKNYAEIENEIGLEKDLQSYLGRSQLISYQKTTIFDFLQSSQIKIVDKLSDWEEGLSISAQILEEKGYINSCYSDEVKKKTTKYGFYSMYGKHICLPHAEYASGVKKASMSMVISKHPFQYGDFQPNIMILLAPDKEATHLNALLDILSLSEEPNKIKEIIDSKNGEEVIEKLQLWSD